MKAKTKSSLKKRVKFSKDGKGKASYQKGNRNHRLEHKSKRSKVFAYLTFPKSFVKQLKRLLPNRK